MNTLIHGRHSFFNLIGFLFLWSNVIAQTTLSSVWEHQTTASPYAHSRILPNHNKDSIYTIYHKPQGPTTLVECKKIDQSGHTLWTYTFEPSPQFTDNRLVDASLDLDGNLILAINAQFFVFAGEDSHYGTLVYILKLSPNGALIWEKSYQYDPTSYARAHSLITNGEGLTMLSGGRGDAGFQWVEEEAFVIALDKDGVLQWELSAGSSQGILLGMLEGQLQLIRRENYFSYYLHTIDQANGNILNTHHFQDDDGNSSFQLSEQQANYLVLSNSHYGISEVSITGELLWNYSLNNSGSNQPRDLTYQVLDTPEGELFVLGRYEGDLLLTKLDSEGNLIWETSYTGNYFCNDCTTYKYQPMQKHGGSLFVLGSTTEALRLLEFALSSGDTQQEIRYEVEASDGLSIPRSLLNIEDNFYWSNDVQRDGQYYFTLLKYATRPSANNDIKTLTGLQVYPNPTPNKVLIHHPNANLSHLILYSSQGQLVQQLQGPSTPAVFELSSVPAGIYWLNVHTTDGKQAWQKIVKQ